MPTNAQKTAFALLFILILSACSPAASRTSFSHIEIDQPSNAPTRQVVMPKGFGILGDSFYDEYQADDNRGGLYHKTTFNPIEILVRARQLNVGPWGTRDAPRRTGYAYNWALSGATSETLINAGQHTGLAEQVRAGEVTHVLISIGTNDFNPIYGPAYTAIYDGTMTDAQLQEKINKAIKDVTLAVDTIIEAGAEGVMVTYFTQWDLDPLISRDFPDAARRQRVAKAIDAVNQGIQTAADERGIVAINQNAIGLEMLSKLEDKRYLVVGGERIDFFSNGDEPRNLRLGDNSHLGTVMSGYAANKYIIEPLNKHFDLYIPPLTDEEILKIAGMRK